MSATSIEILEGLYVALGRIEREGPYVTTKGLCGQPMEFFWHEDISLYVDILVGRHLQGFIREWAEERGVSATAPIEGSVEAYHENSQKWDKNTEHGKLRWKMISDIKFMIIEEIRGLSL